MTQRITKAHVANQLEIFAGYVGKETRDQLIERVITARETYDDMSLKEARKYWLDPEYIENKDDVLDIGEYNGHYKITGGDGYFGKSYGGAATSKRAIYEVLYMVNGVLREQVRRGEIEDYAAMKGNR